MNILFTKQIRRDYKRLSKKYVSLPDDFKNLLETLKTTPDIGTPIDKGYRKVRLQITSKGKGKSGGARVITFHYAEDVHNGDLVLITMYDKNEYDNVRTEYIDEAFLGLEDETEEETEE